MLMSAKFPEEFPGELLVDLGRRLAGGTIGLKELKDASWCLGCLVELFDGDPTSLPVTAFAESTSLEELGQELVEMGEQEEGTAQAANIAVWLPIIMQIIRLILDRIGNRGGNNGGTVPGPV